MNKREFDIIVYGANGYTAFYVIKQLEKFNLKIALAARNEILVDTKFKKIVCDINNIKSITSKTNVLLNCVGPYSLYGEPIIQACLETSTHYLDICGEPGFLEKIYQKYNKIAEEKNIKIIQACGFDSFPCDFGCFLLSKKLKASNLEIIISMSNSKGNVTSYKSLVQSLVEYHNRNHKNDDKNSNKNIIDNNNNKSKVNKNNNDKNIVDNIMNKENKNTNFKNIAVNNINIMKEFMYVPDINSYVVKFRGSDPYITKRSMNYFRTQGICFSNISCYFKIGSIISLIFYYLFLIILFFFTKFEKTTKILLKYPQIFTFGVFKNKPKKEEVENSYFKIYFKVKNDDYKNNTYDLIISGVNPGYLSTAIFLTQSAVTLIKDEKKITSGVITPAIAFYKTAIMKDLISSGITFEFNGKNN